MAEEGKTPGNAYTSPFGNGKGATMADGPSTGAHNFIEDPSSNAPKTGGRDFTAERREQRSGMAPDIDKASVPAGGTMPFGTGDRWSRVEETADGGIEPAQMPFRNLK